MVLYLFLIFLVHQFLLVQVFIEYIIQKNSIFSITKKIQKTYENLSGEKTEIIFNNKFNTIKDEFVAKDLEKEIELMVLYFLKENLNKWKKINFLQVNCILKYTISL